ncbi:hypothetical protein FOVSG1_013642 [Fusarium oxysporum f. sp. vasinfectum]
MYSAITKSQRLNFGTTASWMAKNPTQTTTAVWLALALVGMREANLPTPATTMAAKAVGLFAISNSWQQGKG